MTPWRVQTVLAMARHYDEHGYTGGNPFVLRAILGREPTTYRAFAKRFLTEQGELAHL